MNYNSLAQTCAKISTVLAISVLLGKPAIASNSTDDSNPFANQEKLANLHQASLPSEATEQPAWANPELVNLVAQNQVAETSATGSNAEMLEQILDYSSEGNNEALSQVTSITQLADVRPTDWAFQALQSLIERYGCVAGYPDGTFRGNQAMTRYEAAALVNACLDRVSELLDLGDFVTQDDLAAIQRLQEEFAAELATLRGRVDGLEARVSELEANQFSTTTKLRGEVLFLVSGVFDQDDQFDDQVIFVNRVRLNFDTSFSGEDRLRTRLQARNIPRFNGDQIGFQTGGNEGNVVQLDDLIYTFPIGNFINATVGANSLDIDDLTRSIITPHGQSSGSGAISEFADPRQYETFAGSGAGAGAIINLIDEDDVGLSLDFGYVGNEPTGVSEGSGFFNGNYSIIGQLTFTSDFLDAAVTYVNAYDDTTVSSEISRVYDFEGPVIGNTYGGQINFKLGDDGQFQLGGGVAYTDVTGIGARPDYDLWSWQGTFALQDLGGDGNLLGILAGVPQYTRDLPGQTRDTGFLTELYYRFNINNNIALTPSVIWLADPFNNNEIDDTIIGTLRTTFRF
jgi:hypothetical protein